MNNTGRSRRSGALALALASFLAALAGCQTEHACTLIGCLDGLIIAFDRVPSTPVEVFIEDLGSAPDRRWGMRCTAGVAMGGGLALDCTSAVAHTALGDRVHVPGVRSPALAVMVRRGTETVSEQAFEPAFSTREINGPGCGTCTQATVTVKLP